MEQELDLSVFERRYSNDEEGRPAYDPAILLKIVGLGYSRGVTSSRRIARLCEQNVLFMAVSADTRPHFTTIANFVSGYPEEIAGVFRQVVLVCDEMGLIGGEMFAVDGCKLPSNASKEWSGTRADMTRKVAKLDRAIRRIMERHRQSDGKDREEEIAERERKQVKKLRRVSRKLKEFLATHDEKIGASGKPVQSNVTDNESAKTKTPWGDSGLHRCSGSGRETSGGGARGGSWPAAGASIIKASDGAVVALFVHYEVEMIVVAFVPCNALPEAGHAAEAQWLCDSRRPVSPRDEANANSESRQHIDEGVCTE